MNVDGKEVTRLEGAHTSGFIRHGMTRHDMETGRDTYVTCGYNYTILLTVVGASIPIYFDIYLYILCKKQFADVVF